MTTPSNQKKQVYLISGLATDERVFKHIRLKNADVRYLKWLQPDPDESLQEYARKMCGFIPQNSSPILIGYSFGGIVAIEMSRFIKTEKVITIASINSLKELPWNLALVKALKIYKLLPVRPFAKIYPVTNFIFGTETQEEAKMLKEIIKNADPDLLDWSVDKMLNWSCDYLPENLYRIHGTHDRIFPYRLTSKTVAVKNGTHLMVVNKYQKINEILNKLIHQQNTENE